VIRLLLIVGALAAASTFVLDSALVDIIYTVSALQVLFAVVASIISVMTRGKYSFYAGFFHCACWV
jgi:hypothetical protein